MGNVHFPKQRKFEVSTYPYSSQLHVHVHVCYCLLSASPIVETVGTEGDTEDDVIADGHLQPLDSGDDDDED